jgi:hypothetical protein
MGILKEGKRFHADLIDLGRFSFENDNYLVPVCVRDRSGKPTA